MSLLRNQSVNPLNNPAPAAAPVEVPPQQAPAYEVPPAYGQQTMPVPQAVSAPGQMVSGYVSSALPTQFAPMAESTDGGFDQLEIGYGSFPHIVLQTSVFELDGESMGNEFKANLSQSRKMYVYRDRKASDNSARVVYSYDRVTTTSGEPLAPIFQTWRAEGMGDPIEEIRTQAVALILDGPFAGQIAICSIPKTGTDKLVGYRLSLNTLRRKIIPQVVTRVFTGAPIKTKSGQNFIPWNFEYAGDYNAEQLAA
jgi:type IV secretory pathway VirB2 component (pilin)